MRKGPPRSLLASTVVLVLSRLAAAAPNFVPTTLFVVTNPSPANAVRRQVRFAGQRSGGFRYRGRSGAGAAVTASVDREEIGGDFVLKWKLVGTLGPIDVVPQAGNPGFALNFKIGNGGEYCDGGSTPSGSTSSDRVYRVKNGPPPVACGVSSCSPGAAP